MISALGALAAMLCASLASATRSAPDCLAPPTAPTYKWLDPFTVNVSWSEPSGLPERCDVIYLVQASGDSWRTPSRSIVDTIVSDGSARCTYTIRTVFKDSCDRNHSAPASVTVDTSKSHARVVKELGCVRQQGLTMICSWTPVNPSHNLTLSYRICGGAEKHRKPLQTCERPPGSRSGNSCFLSGDIVKHELCMLASTPGGWSTFKPAMEFTPPLMNVSVNGSRFQLSLRHPDMGPNCYPTYEVCHKACDKETCKSYSLQTDAHALVTIPYNKMCRHEFKARLNGTRNCMNMISKFCEPQRSEGAAEPPDATLTAVAVLTPVVLSVCMVLSCYCFRRHRYIICPIIPDPSAIFKEMMMNGNKDSKPSTGNLYTPVPEPTAPCKIDIPPENSLLQPVL